MNFVWFIVALIAFEVFYWYFISMILFVPAMPAMALLGYAGENSHKKWIRIFLFPMSLVLAFIFGTLLNCLVFGGGLGWLVLPFVEKATHPWIYYIIAGLGAFFIAAPSGETNLLAMVLSLLSYLAVVFMEKAESIMGGIIGWFYGILSLIIGIAVLILIGYGVLKGSNFLVKRLTFREQINSEKVIISRIGYFKGYCVLNIILMLGGLISVVLFALFFSQYIEFNNIAAGIVMVLVYTATFVYWILLYRLYKVLQSLKRQDLLSVRPSLVLIITIVLTYTVPIAPIIPFIAIWIKSNKYLKYETQKIPD